MNPYLHIFQLALGWIGVYVIIMKKDILEVSKEYRLAVWQKLASAPAISLKIFLWI